MKGMAFIKCNNDGTYKSSIDKFYDEKKLKTIAEAAGAKAGDLVLIIAGAEEEQERLPVHCAWKWRSDRHSEKPGEFKLLWVVDFPLFEYDEEGNRWVARHHPFTSPKQTRGRNR